jgi:hypothetical protein
MAITQAPQTDTGETFTSRNPGLGEALWASPPFAHYGYGAY